MTLIALMPPLSFIKRLKMYLQATIVFFCHLCSTNIFFINTNFICLVTYLSYTTYYIVLIGNFKKLIKLLFFFFFFDIEDNIAYF